MILGLDVSTSKIGIAVLDNDKKLKYLTVIKCKKDHCLEERALNLFNEQLELVKKEFNITEIRVEEPFSSFRGGKTTAVTMSKLQRFNGMVSVLLYQKFKLVPMMIGVKSARKCCGIYIPKGGDIKGTVISWVSKTYPDDFKYDLTPKGNPKPGTDDKADAIVIAYSHFNLT
jgi:Holliday junction resolvasome RuvABC endonuclease subunit